MAGYYLAPSLAVLRDEINQRWPGRDKASDGWIGDAAHQATRSDHNPNERGSVNALDVDEDGIDFGVVFAAIRRHPSARYVIYEHRLYHRLRGWRSEPYSGVNPHDHHFHLSIDQTREAEQDTRPWGLLEDDMPLTDADQPVIKAAVHNTPIGRTGKTFGVVLDELRFVPDRVEKLATELAASRLREEAILAKVTADDEDVEKILRHVDQVAATLTPPSAAEIAEATVVRLGEEGPEQAAQSLIAVLGPDRAALLAAALSAATAGGPVDAPSS